LEIRVGIVDLIIKDEQWESVLDSNLAVELALLRAGELMLNWFRELIALTAIRSANKCHER